MDREKISEINDLLGKVADALGALPHRDAAPALENVGAIHSLVNEDLPGGYFCDCEGCGLPIGIDENSASSDAGTFCPDCIARWNDDTQIVKGADE